MADKVPVYGYCDLDTCTIALDSKLTGERALATLRHEIGHAAWHESGFGFLSQQAVKDEASLDFLEEDFVRRVLPVYLASIKEIDRPSSR